MHALSYLPFPLFQASALMGASCFVSGAKARAFSLMGHGEEKIRVRIES